MTDPTGGFEGLAEHVTRYLGPPRATSPAPARTAGSATANTALPAPTSAAANTALPLRADAVASGRRTAEMFRIAVHDHAALAMATAVTDGVRLRFPGAPLPLEFACSARPERADDAVVLLRLFTERALEAGEEVEYDDGLVVAEPLVAGTRIHGLLAAPHPYADEMFNLFRNARGELRLQFVTLVPITDAEAAYLNDHETDELFDLWKAGGTDLLDLTRPPL